MANGNGDAAEKALMEGIQRTIDAIPGDLWDKADLVRRKERESVEKTAMLKAISGVLRSRIAEDKKDRAFVAARLRYQQSFGFGMSVERGGPTKQ